MLLMDDLFGPTDGLNMEKQMEHLAVPGLCFTLKAICWLLQVCFVAKELAGLRHTNTPHQNSMLTAGKYRLRDVAALPLLWLTRWLMVPGGSMQHSQGHSNNCYPEPNQSNLVLTLNSLIVNTFKSHILNSNEWDGCTVIHIIYLY